MSDIIPCVSIIVTTYNRKELLKETLDSILNQTFTDFELIVVDNYSNYDFISFIKSFKDNRIIAYQNANNGIIAVNRNYGIKKARGKYIAFCDDDDLWMPEKLEIQVKLLKSQKAIAIGSDLFINRVRRKVTLIKKWHKLFQKDLLYNLSGVAFSSLIIRNNQEYNFSTKREDITIEDYTFQLYLTNNNRFIIKIRKPLIIYRVHDMNYSSISQLKKSFNKASASFDKVPKILLQNYHYNLSKAYLSNKKLHLFRKYLITSLINEPFSFKILKIIKIYVFSLLSK